MGLAEQRPKLTIQPEGVSEEDAIKVMFNPNTYTVTKTAHWRHEQDFRADSPTVAFGGGGPRELSLELFFDVTELPGNRDVRQETDRVVALAYMMRDKAKPRPPICVISWGPASRINQHDLSLPFTGLLTSVTQKFTLFRASGSPVRATLNVTFTEFLRREDNLRITDPDETTRTMRAGDTVHSVAARCGVTWRVLALANLSEFPNANPRLAPPGTELKVPKVV